MQPILSTGPFQINPDRYAKALFKLNLRRIWWLYVLFGVLLSGLLTIAMKASLPVAVAIAAIGMTIGVFFAFQRQQVNVKRPGQANAFRVRDVILSDESIRQEYDLEGSHLEFKLFAITQVAEEEEFFFVFATRRHMMTVPYGAFRTAEDRETFRAKLREAAR